MDLATLLFATGLLLICFVGLGTGVLFFGKAAEKTDCRAIPNVEADVCASQKAGLCPFEDKQGYVKAASSTRLSYPKH